MSDASQLNRKFTFSHGSRTWELSRPNLGTEGLFATYMERKDIEWAGRVREYSYADYREALALAREAASGNDYGWCRPGLNDPHHTAKFLWFWFAQCFKSAPLALTEKEMVDIYNAQKFDAAGNPFKPGESPLDMMIGEAVSDPCPLPPL